jgi:hypothetical protein
MIAGGAEIVNKHFDLLSDVYKNDSNIRLQLICGIFEKVEFNKSSGGQIISSDIHLKSTKDLLNQQNAVIRQGVFLGDDNPDKLIIRVAGAPDLDGSEYIFALLDNSGGLYRGTQVHVSKPVNITNSYEDLIKREKIVFEDFYQRVKRKKISKGWALVKGSVQVKSESSVFQNRKYTITIGPLDIVARKGIPPLPEGITMTHFSGKELNLKTGSTVYFVLHETGRKLKAFEEDFRYLDNEKVFE